MKDGFSAGQQIGQLLRKSSELSEQARNHLSHFLNVSIVSAVPAVLAVGRAGDSVPEE